MKKTHRIILEVLALIIVTCMLCLGIVSSSAASDDPADSYHVQTAPNEDSTLQMWFDYSFRKTFTGDKTSTGMDTFSIYMGKNEIESAQFVLYSDVDHTGMTTSLSAFTDGKGNTVDAEVYYEMYVTTENLATTSVIGSTEETTPIRAGETPDPVIPISALKNFKLNGGKSQAFLIRATTKSDSVSGWYSAQLDIKNSSGQIVKTATVYLYVWNFEISDKTELKTAFILSNDTSWGGDYTTFYNYFLENRLNPMDVPGGMTSSTNSYLTNDRVAATRVSSNGCNNINSYMEAYNGAYANIYNDLASSDIWDEVKDKLYFYTADEPMSLEQQTAIGNSGGATVDTANYYGAMVSAIFPGAQMVVPFHENHPYPYYTYHQNLNTLKDYEIKDGFQEMLDHDYVTIWCPQIYAFTPSTELTKWGYAGLWGDKIRSLSCTISGMWSSSTTPYTYASVYMNWEKLYGDAYDRIQSKIAIKEDAGERIQMWSYSAGWNKGYTYCNHLIENTGLQTKLLFWQLYQNDVTGYLYYGTNNWSEYGAANDTTVTGAKTTCTWRTNRHDYLAVQGGNSIFGNGVLFYGRTMARVNVQVVGSLRVELLRDGVEEYQMMSMLADLKGDDVAKSYVNSISNNVVDYISMPKYNRSAWDSSMDEYDIMESVRRSLGNALEAAVNEGECDHTFDEGEVTKEAGCLTVGTMTYTCTKCGTKDEQVIPAKHTEGSCFTVESSTEATCTTDGSRIERCTICGYRRTITTKAYHNDSTIYVYKYVSDTTHKSYCPSCDAEMAIGSHVYLYKSVKATCQEEGYTAYVCKCGDKKDETTLPIVDHNYVNGKCTMCGLSDGTGPVEPEEPEVMYGDTNGDGKINALDANYLAQIIVGNAASVEAADISKDGKVNATDSNLLKQIIAGTYTIA